MVEPLRLLLRRARRHARRRRSGRGDVRLRLVRARHGAGHVRPRASAVARRRSGRGADGRGARAVGPEALRRTWRASTRSSPSPRSSSTASRARPSPSSSAGATPPAAETPAGRAAQLMQILREWRGGLHLVATTAAGLSPLEAILTNEGTGQAQVLRLARALPRRRRHQDEARRGRGHHRPAVRGLAGPGAGRREVRGSFEAGVAGTAGRHPVGPPDQAGPGVGRTGDRLQ